MRPALKVVIEAARLITTIQATPASPNIFLANNNCGMEEFINSSLGTLAAITTVKSE